MTEPCAELLACVGEIDPTRIPAETSKLACNRCLETIAGEIIDDQTLDELHGFIKHQDGVTPLSRDELRRLLWTPKLSAQAELERRVWMTGDKS